MKSVVSVAAAVALAAQCVGATDNPLTPEKLVADIKKEELERNLWNLNEIAKRNGGNRAAGFPGYAESSDYVLERAQKRFAPEYDSWTQSFNYTFHQTREFRVTGPDGEEVEAISMLYNAATPVPDGVTAPLVDTPVDDERGSLCFEDQWTDDFDVTGKLALLKRGGCDVSDKLRLAKAHGAVGAIMYHNAPGKPTLATLGAASEGQIVPVGTITQELGEAWRARLAAGETLAVTLLVDSVFETRESWNVFAETKEGSADSVVMLGAHLDSVQAGAGINDDGSGTSALLELMTALRRYNGFPNKVRFAWWGAEESGLVGSLHYTSTLPAEEADKIRFYFNYDMIGSPYPTFGVSRGDNPGDAVGAQKLYDYLTAAGRAPFYGAWGGGSDHVGFLELGISASGIHTGTSAGGQDPCYHLACDDIDNVNWDALTDNAKAAAAALAELALSLDGVPPRAVTSPNPRSRRGVRAAFDRWAAAAETAETSHSCSHSSTKRTV